MQHISQAMGTLSSTSFCMAANHLKIKIFIETFCTLIKFRVKYIWSILLHLILHLFLQKPTVGCGGVGDFLELLGGNGLDPSKMFPLADLCHSFHGPGEILL